MVTVNGLLGFFDDAQRAAAHLDALRMIVVHCREAQVCVIHVAAVGWPPLTPWPFGASHSG
jgi:hypothetical protein